MPLRIAFFQKEEESFWQPLHGNPHFRQRLLATACFKALPIKLKKWQLITATLELNAGKAHQGTQANSVTACSFVGWFQMPAHSPAMRSCSRLGRAFISTRLFMYQTALAWGSGKEDSNRSKQPLMSVGHDEIHFGYPACAQVL
jgi:hypothetical protein